MKCEVLTFFFVHWGVEWPRFGRVLVEMVVVRGQEAIVARARHALFHFGFLPQLNTNK